MQLADHTKERRNQMENRIRYYKLGADLGQSYLGNQNLFYIDLYLNLQVLVNQNEDSG